MVTCIIGKDVYVEKPLTITIREGRAMVNAQAQTKRVVAVGLNRRGARVYQKLVNEIRAGKIGRISVGMAILPISCSKPATRIPSI